MKIAIKNFDNKQVREVELPEEIFGYPDDLKFHSSMTLFAQAAEMSEEDLVFSAALDKYFGGKEDAATMQRL